MTAEVLTLPADMADVFPPWERIADNAWRRSFNIGPTPVTQTLVITGAQRDVHTIADPPGHLHHVTIGIDVSDV